MGRFRDLYEGFFNGMRMPMHLEASRGRCLLHVSDTPSVFFHDLERLLASLRPCCLVHTGDLVDDVKTGLRKGFEGIYRERLKKLSRILSSVPPGQTVLACGNHDIFDLMIDLFRGCRLFAKGGRMDLCGFDVAVGHSLEEIPRPPADYNFYGHDTTPPRLYEGSVFLNGVTGINVLDTVKGTVETIPYPRYVDEARCCIRKSGL